MTARNRESMLPFSRFLQYCSLTVLAKGDFRMQLLKGNFLFWAAGIVVLASLGCEGRRTPGTGAGADASAAISAVVTKDNVEEECRKFIGMIKKIKK